jgi:hypothetical protein
MAESNPEKQGKPVSTEKGFVGRPMVPGPTSNHGYPALDDLAFGRRVLKVIFGIVSQWDFNPIFLGERIL